MNVARLPKASVTVPMTQASVIVFKLSLNNCNITHLPLKTVKKQVTAIFKRLIAMICESSSSNVKKQLHVKNHATSLCWVGFLHLRWVKALKTLITIKQEPARKIFAKTNQIHSVIAKIHNPFSVKSQFQVLDVLRKWPQKSWWTLKQTGTFR